MTQGSAKRLCLEDVTLAMGPSFPQPPFSTGTGMSNQGSGLEGNRLNSNNGLGSPYSMPPKASPGSTSGGAGSSGSLAPAFNPNGNPAAPSVEQELQEILDELTKNPDPSLPELDIEKILGNKTDEQTSNAGNFVHLDGSGTPKRSPQRPSHLEAHLTQSPGFPQAGSPQMGASPAAVVGHHQPSQACPSKGQQGSSWAWPISTIPARRQAPKLIPPPANPSASQQHPESTELPHLQHNSGHIVICWTFSSIWAREKLASPALAQPPFSHNNSVPLLPGSTASGSTSNSTVHMGAKPVTLS
ncbi:hypothetical protein NFI96_023307, partial [Prochilodus magdalenae]